MISSKWLDSFQNGHSTNREAAAHSTAAPATHQSHRRRHQGRCPEPPELPVAPVLPEINTLRALDTGEGSRSGGRLSPGAQAARARRAATKDRMQSARKTPQTIIIAS